MNEMKTLAHPAGLPEKLRHLRHIALDMDGTLYNGSTLFPFSAPFLDKMKELGIGYSFLSNNPSKSTADYVRHLAGMGIAVTPGEFYTSAQATIDYLKQHYPECRRLFILGTPSMIGEFTGAGFESAGDEPGDEPDAVVVSFDLSLVYPRLCRAAWWIDRGKPYIATNPDRVCPTDEPLVLVDCGSICSGLEYATGRKPDVVVGKPDPRMLHGIMARHELAADQVAMVGDRIYTDILMARRAGAFGVLVLSGETDRATAVAADPGPDLIVNDLAEFQQLLMEAYRYRQLT